MKRLLTILIAVSATATSAATVYRDRIIPVGQPCMITFAGREINATMIADVAIGSWTDYERRLVKTGFLIDEYENIYYKALRVTLANNRHFQVTTEPFEAQRAELLKQIAACRSK